MPALGARSRPSRRTVTWASVAPIAGFTALTAAVASHATRPLDIRVHDALAAHPGDALVEPMRDVAVLGGVEVTAAAALLLAGAAALRPPLRRIVAAAAAALAISSLVELAAKRWVDQPVPSGIADRTSVVIATSGSYPSGHVLRVLVIGAAAVACATRHRRIALVAAVAAAALVVASRLLLGVHWLSDIVAGLLLGGALGAGIVVLPARSDGG